MTKRKLAIELCKREGKKSQVAIGNMMEVLSRLEEIFAEQRNNYVVLNYEQAMSERVTKLAAKLLKKGSK